MEQIIKKEDDPIYLLEKPSYRTVVLKSKAPMLSTLFLSCCYSQEFIFKVYKWLPADENLANG